MNIYFIVSLALLVRLFFSFVILPHFFSNRDLASFGGYDLLAERFVNGYGFTYLDGTVNLQRLPLYILFLAAHYAVFGTAIGPILFTQALLGSFSVYLIWYLGRMMLKDQHTKLAALIYALYPFAIWRNASLLADVIMVPLLLIAVISIAKLLQESGEIRLSFACLIAFECSLLTYTKPIAALLPFVVVLLIFLLKRGTLKNKIISATVIISVYALLLLPWVVRNALITDKFPMLSDGAGFVRVTGVVYADNFDIHNMSSKNLDELSQQQLNKLNQQYNWKHLPNPEMYSFHDDKEMSAYVTREHILSEPLQAFRRYIQHLAFFWFLADSHMKSLAYLVLQVPIVLLALLGFIRRFSDISKPQILMGFIILYFWGLNSLILGQVRYADALIPLVFVLAATCMARWPSGWGWMNQRGGNE
jgi:4-amino-4-deoxy-L-arabinose transferase-like glycosyltransferase